MSNNNWTIEFIPDLTGKVIIVTGGNSGLGFESVKAFAQKGAEVILACRSMDKGEAAKESILKEKTTGTIAVMTLDLMDLASVKRFATSFNEKYDKLDVLLNNAGIMTTPYFLTENGFEGQMGTNHLGHFALTGLLLDLIVKTPQSRVINVSSLAHKSGKMDFDNLLFNDGKGYSPMKAYGRSKLSNLLFTYELQQYFESKGIDSMSVASHPGASITNLYRQLEKRFWFRFVKPLFAMVSQEQAMGALPEIRAAVDPDVKGGQYYGPSNGMKGFPVVVKSNAASHNTEDAKSLWIASENLTGIKYLIK